MDSNSEIQGYNVYPMVHFCRKFSSGITVHYGVTIVTNGVDGSEVVVKLVLAIESGKIDSGIRIWLGRNS